MTTKPSNDTGDGAGADETPFRVVAAELRDILGARTCAYLGKATRTDIVERWVNGTGEPDAATQRRLRTALSAAGLIASADSAAVAQAWFMGMNSILEERSAMAMLREGDPDVVGPEIIGAARAYLAS